MMQKDTLDNMMESEAASTEDLRDGSTILYGERRVKYLKPRIGSYFQAKVEKYVAPTAATGEDEEAEMRASNMSSPQKLSVAFDSNSYRKRRRVNNPTKKNSRCELGTFRVTADVTYHSQRSQITHIITITEAMSSEASQSSQVSQEDCVVSSTELDENGEGSNQTNIDSTRKSHNAEWSIDASKYIPLPGGLCVHRPSSYYPQTHDWFLAFGRNIFLETPQSSSIVNHVIERQWKKQELFLRNTTQTEDDATKKVTGKKRGRKRKIRESEIPATDNGNSQDELPIKLDTGTETEELFEMTSISTKVPSTARTSSSDPGDSDKEGGSQDSRLLDNRSLDDNLIQEQESANAGHEQHPTDECSSSSILIGLENDEAMLEYLQLQHHGNIDRGKFIVLSSLSMGKAVEARRLQRKYLKNEDPADSLTVQHTDSWRRRYERVTDPLIGYLRRKQGIRMYPYTKNDSPPQSMDSDNLLADLYPWCSFTKSNFMMNDVPGKLQDVKDQSEETTDDIYTSWNHILAASKHALESIQKKSNKNRPTFRQVLNILEKAYGMPNPEDVFGRRDTLSRTAGNCMNALMDLVDICRNSLAELMDGAFSHHIDGVDLILLRKIVNRIVEKTPLVMDEIDMVRSMLDEAEAWESKSIKMSDDSDLNAGSGIEHLRVPQLSLSFVEALCLDGQALSLRPRSLVLLEDKIEKAYMLRTKICKWKKSMDDEHENIKYVSTMIRDANKVNLSFPELSFLSKVHRDAEDWMEKAQVAIRTRITLFELDALVRSGGDLPVDFADVIVKLENRYEQACEWISELREIIPCPSEHVSRTAIELDCKTRDEWFERMLEALMTSEEEDRIPRLLELSSQGSRLPVDIELLGLLQVSIDAKNWSLKAKRWVPSLSGDQWRRGKIEDIDEHLDQANIIREKRKTMTGRNIEWLLHYEQELQAISTAADDWLNKYRVYLDGDNRRAQGRPCVSFATLNQVINELEAIPCNLGNAGLKMNKVFNQAQVWINSSRCVLQTCGVHVGSKDSKSSTVSQAATIEELNSAIDDALKDIAMDLEEAKELQKVSIKVRKWLDRVNDIAPRRNKRVGRAKSQSNSKYTMNEVLLLIEEANNLPLNLSSDVERLTLQLGDAKAWRLSTQSEIRALVNVLEKLYNERNNYFGLPDQYADFSIRSPTNRMNDAENGNEKTEDTAIMDHSQEGYGKVPSIDSEFHQMIEALVRSSETMCILTVEETIVDFLELVSNWCRKGFELINAPYDIYTEKKSFKELDITICEAESMLMKRWPQGNKCDDIDDETLLEDLSRSCTKILSGDLERLRYLHTRRKEYFLWCEKALALLSSDNEKPFSLDALLKLESEGAAFPPSADTVISVRNRASTAIQWISSVTNMINSHNPIPFEEATTVLLEGEQMNINSLELRTLRNAVKMTRSWIGRVKKLDLELGSSDVNIITDLLREHDAFLVSSAEHAARLKQAVCNYCICRRPYDGFMIGCDECDEWYHGLCIGVSEAQAEKCDKYICIRCSIKKQYFQLCSSIAFIMKKWCDPKELLKSRQNEGQKLQRRIREKKREILKLQEEMESSARSLQTLTNDRCPTISSTASQYDPSILNHTSEIDPASNNLSTVADIQSHEDADREMHTLTENHDDSRAEIIELKAKLQADAKAIEHCQQRLNDILALSKEKKELEDKEDVKLSCLRYWFVLIRCNIIAPKSMDIANKSRPVLSSDSLDLLSDPIKEIIREASTLELLDFVDVNTVISNFSSIGWCLAALGILRRKPTIGELQMLFEFCSAIKYPDPKCVGLIRSMISRTTLWQSHVRKLLDGYTATNNVTVWHEQLSLASSIPVVTQEHTWLECIIADGCKNHCICGGPVRMTLMLSCDSCGNWFHGSCVQISEADAVSLPLWLCPSCSSSNATISSLGQKHSCRVRHWEPSPVQVDVSNVAPDPSLIWPPYGLADGSNAITAFGGLVCSIDIADIRRPQVPSHQMKDMEAAEDRNDASRENGIGNQTDIATDEPAEINGGF